MIKLSCVNNIKIKYTGLRDGETLYEEVLNTFRTYILPTHNLKIKIAKVREYNYNKVKAYEDFLYKSGLDFDDMKTVRIMKDIVPEFKRKYSNYEILVV